MIELTSDELLMINGGFKWKIGIALAAGISFLIGVVDGYLRPLPCK